MSRQDRKGPDGRRLVRAIAVFKVAKALVMLALATGAFALVGRDLPRTGERIVQWLAIDPTRELVQRALDRLPSVTTGMLEVLGGGALASAALYLVEAYGLFRERAWGEWLVVVVTGSFIPLEVWQVVDGATRQRVLVLVVNVAIVAFLAWRRWRARAARLQAA